jgi:hypothetical protein
MKVFQYLTIMFIAFAAMGCAAKTNIQELVAAENNYISQPIQGKTVERIEPNKRLEKLILSLQEQPITRPEIARYLYSIKSADGKRMLVIFKTRKKFDSYIIYVVRKRTYVVSGWYRYNNV